MAKRNGGIIGPSNVPTGQYGGTASGVWRLRDAFNYIKAGLWPVAGNYPVGNSLRFNSGSSDYLSRTTGTPTNNKILTFSAWIKRSKITTYMDLFDQDGGSSYGQLQLTNGDAFVIYQRTSGSTDFHLQTTQLFRDVSAWYHLVVAYDTTQATSSNRIKLYVNGTQVTSFSIETYPSQNLAIRQNTSSLGITIANYSSGSNQYDGYLSEIFMIDGQQLTPSSFGQTDSATGIWTPLPYTGTFGTNGFYLKFANSAALGTDSSGNGNTWTANNLTSVDQSTDTPTNNFATLNPLVATGGTYTEGNLQYLTATTDGAWSWSSISPSGGGNWYCEAKMISSSNGTYQLGITAIASGFSPRVQYVSNGGVYVDGSNVATYATYTTNDIIGMAYNSSTKSLTFYKNGTSQGSQTATSSNDYYFGSTGQSGGASHTIAFNFGSPSYAANSYADGAGYGNFSYAVPSGYYALNTKNLANFG
jgi:hypothetical protein